MYAYTHVCIIHGLVSGFSKTDYIKVLKQSQVGDERCDLCYLMVRWLLPFVNKNCSEKAIEYALHNFCTLIPGDIGKQVEREIGFHLENYIF